MSFEAWLMLAILIVMFALLVWNKLPAWIVFTGTVCHTTVHSTAVVSRPSQLNLRAS